MESFSNSPAGLASSKTFSAHRIAGALIIALAGFDLVIGFAALPTIIREAGELIILYLIVMPFRPTLLIICGVGIWKRKKWARNLFTVLVAFTILYYLQTLYRLYITGHDLLETPEFKSGIRKIIEIPILIFLWLKGRMFS